MVKYKKVVDDANQKLELQRFKTKGRKKERQGWHQLTIDRS